mgnify:CR=1 FL=1
MVKFIVRKKMTKQTKSVQERRGEHIGIKK